jgi:hypothetical protein
VERLGIIEEIASDTSFQNAENNDVRMQLARFLVPFGTPEKLIKELVMMAKGVNEGKIDLDAIRKKVAKTNV